MDSPAAPPATPADSSTPADARAAAARPAWLSWLAWAVGVPVVLISGFTHPTNEFATPHRVMDGRACNGCWHDLRVRFDHKGFLWCPRHAGMPRQFECTRLIMAEQVTRAIQKVPGFVPWAVRSDTVTRTAN
jgi:autotransporter strand-loop-strand O-heptosyltransferase